MLPALRPVALLSVLFLLLATVSAFVRPASVVSRSNGTPKRGVRGLSLGVGRCRSPSAPFDPGIFHPRTPTHQLPTRTRARATCTMAAATATQHVVVGKGRVGEALQKMLPAGSTVMVGRDDAIPVDGTGPIYVATRNDDLAAVIDKTPANRRKDLVFMQNGWLGSFLEGYGLQDNTQVRAYVGRERKC